MQICKVSATTSARKLAGVIAMSVRSGEQIELHAVGGGAVNQAVKAVAIARGFVAAQGYNLTTTPAFHVADVDGSEKTAIKFTIHTK